MRGQVERLNPEGLHKNPAYSQAVVTSGSLKTVYVGGQNAVDASGEVVGAGDIKLQAEQIFENLQTALAAGERGSTTSSNGTSMWSRDSRLSPPSRCSNACGANGLIRP